MSADHTGPAEPQHYSIRCVRPHDLVYEDNVCNSLFPYAVTLLCESHTVQRADDKFDVFIVLPGVIIAAANLRSFCGHSLIRGRLKINCRLSTNNLCVNPSLQQSSYMFLFFLADYLGINIMKRKLAEHDNLKITIEQTGDKFHIKESSTFRTKDIDFTLGVQFDYSLADGTELSVSAL